MDNERKEVLRVLTSLPAGDRVLLLPAEADAPPIFPFTTDRGALRRAISEAPTSSGVAYSARAGNGQGCVGWLAAGAACLYWPRDALRAASAPPGRNSYGHWGYRRPLRAT